MSGQYSSCSIAAMAWSFHEMPFSTLLIEHTMLPVHIEKCRYAGPGSTRPLFCINFLVQVSPADWQTQQADSSHGSPAKFSKPADERMRIIGLVLRSIIVSGWQLEMDLHHRIMLC